MRQFLQSAGHNWREAGLARRLNRQRVREARVKSIVLLPVIAGIIVAYDHRQGVISPEWDTAVGIITAIVLVALGFEFARDVGRALGPILLSRLDPGTAGTVGFLIRLLTLAVITAIALGIAGLDPRTLALGGAATVVVAGLAAQQTLGNVFAGTVMLAARPFRVGERVRLQGGDLAGTLEGVVSSLGLLYTTLSRGEDQVLVPNSTVLRCAVVPLKEPDAVELRVRLRHGVTPADMQDLLEHAIETPLLDRPRITLEELDGDELVVRIAATPMMASDGPRLSTEVLNAVAPQTVRPGKEPEPGPS